MKLGFQTPIYWQLRRELCLLAKHCLQKKLKTLLFLIKTSPKHMPYDESLSFNQVGLTLQEPARLNETKMVVCTYMNLPRQTVLLKLHSL